jgi:TolA-binding protein
VEALYYLGEIQARQGKWPEAIAHFQRVFVAYQKYGTWASKAYVRCAECFDKLGKRKEAVAHLQEFLRNERLKDFPETRHAKEMLVDWGGTT